MSSAQKEWKVLTITSFPWRSFSTFSRMFLAASFEKVSASIWEGSMFSFSTMYAIFAVMVVVLPVPAPARMSWGAWVCLMASSWRGFRDERREFNVMDTTFLFFILITPIPHTQNPQVIYPKPFGNLQ